MMTVDELNTCERLAQFYADEKLCANIIQSHILLYGSLSTEARDTIKRIEKMGNQTIKMRPCICGGHPRIESSVSIHGEIQYRGRCNKCDRHTKWVKDEITDAADAWNLMNK